MPKMNFLPLATDAWIADTAHLSRVERGLYMDLLILMWRSPECRVPNQIEWIARRLNCSEEEIPLLETVLAEFTQTCGNWRTQKRLLKEWNYVKKTAGKRSDAAKARWNKEKDTCKRIANAVHTQCEWNAPTPTPTLSVPSDKSDGPSGDFDPLKLMFDAGVALLAGAGKSERAARSILGRWRREHGVEAVIAALSSARREGAIEPISFIEASLKRRRRDDETKYVAQVGY